MSRAFSQRRRDRIGRIEGRIEFLAGRIKALDGAKRDRDIAEKSALIWALEELGRLDAIEAAVKDDDGLPTAVQKLIAVSCIVNSRHQPTDADIARTKGLAKLYGWATT